MTTIRIKQQHGSLSWIVFFLLQLLRRMSSSKVERTVSALTSLVLELQQSPAPQTNLKTTLKEKSLTLKYFTLDEFDCKETGQNKMSNNFLIMIDRLREECGFPFVITSGYRAPEHSAEKDKLTKGRHTQGIAADIAVSNGYQRYMIVEKAIELGFKGIGVADGFVHVDLRNVADPVMWTY